MKGRTLFKSPLPRSHVSDASSSAAVATHRLYQVWRGRNKFLLGGRLIFGPDANSIVLTVSLIMTPLALFVAFVSFRLTDLIGKPLGPLVPATAVAVGAFRNYRFFFMFISSTTFLCLYVFVFCWVNLLLIARLYNCSLGRAVVESPVSGFLIVYTFVTAWFVGGLTAFHSYLICTNQTTYENFRYRYEGKSNPHNRGVAANFAEIFLSPIPASKNDFRARVVVDPAALYFGPPSGQYSLGPLSSESKLSFNTRGSLSFDMAKASFDLDYSASAKRTSVASSDFGDIYGGGLEGALERCATQQPRHSIFGGGGGRASRKADDMETMAAEFGMEFAAAAGRPRGREFEAV